MPPSWWRTGCVWFKESGGRHGRAWESEGKGEYSNREGRTRLPGDTVVIHLNDKARNSPAGGHRGVIINTATTSRFPSTSIMMKRNTRAREKTETDQGAEDRQDQRGRLPCGGAETELKDEDYRSFKPGDLPRQRGAESPYTPGPEGRWIIPRSFYIPGEDAGSIFFIGLQVGLKLYVKGFLTDERQDLPPAYLVSCGESSIRKTCA